MPPRAFTSIGDLKPHVGEELAVSDWFEVSQVRIAKFADATDDPQWIHLDPVRALRESPWKSTVAHGFLTLGLLAPLFASALEVGNTRTSINYGMNRVRFPGPVLSGERIRAHFTLAFYEELDPGAQLTWGVTVERENVPKPALVAEWIMRRYP
jgi:acyl dehydratase